MDKNIVYRCLYLYYVKGLSLSQVSDEVGLRMSVVRSITEGVRMADVAVDFFEDRKKGTFDRVYPAPKYNKLGKLDYMSLEHKYITGITHDVYTLKDVSSFLIEDNIEPKQAKKMLQTLTKLHDDVQEKLLDKKLKAILDVLAQPSKWILTDAGLETVYVIPVLDEKLNVIGTELKPNKNFIIPDELWSRYVKEDK